MAANMEKVVLNPEHIQGCEGSIQSAMEFWSARNGPTVYNVWQSLYWQLCKRPELIDEGKSEGEAPAGRQRRIRALYNEVQEKLHGPEHMADALLTQRRLKEAAAEVEVTLEQKRENLKAERIEDGLPTEEHRHEIGTPRSNRSGARWELTPLEKL